MLSPPSLAIIAGVVGAGVGAAAPGLLLARIVESSQRARSGGDAAVAAVTRRNRGIDAAVVAATIGAAEALAALRFGSSWTLPAIAVVLCGLVMLAWCDANFYLLPKRIQHPTTIATGLLCLVGATATGQWHRLGVAVACGAVAFSFFFLLNAINPRALAFGDVRLAGAIGLAAGWIDARRALLAFVIGSLLAGLAAGSLLLTKRARLDSHVPYGFFLVLGAAIAILS